MLAHALLAVATADERTHRPAPAGLIPLTCNEIAHLFISDRSALPHRSPPARVVRLAPPPPGQPLPATSRSGMKIAIYDWEY
jgi:hypothetical protein